MRHMRRRWRYKAAAYGLTHDSVITRAEAATELLARREARKNLMAFTRYTYPQYEVADHHVRICAGLESVFHGDIKRLMIQLPPRGGKSELVSRRFPAWAFGNRPGLEFICSSYSGELATDFGRDVRGIVWSEEYNRLFPECRVDPSSGAAERWATTTGCKYRATGIEGAVTGRGADIFLVDDPVKDRASADSETVQRRVWDFYRSTAYTRLSKDGRIIVCQTRWNDNDLSGLLTEMEQQGGEKWHKIIVPAWNDDGVSFWPDRFPEERLRDIQRTIGAREWSALYMQQPQPAQGTFFQRSWFEDNRYKELPSSLHVYMTSDHARSDEDGDYTVLRVWGVDTKSDLYWLGGWRGQKTPDQWAYEAISLLRLQKPLCWFVENDTIWGSVEPFVRRMMRDAGVACRIERLSTRGDKVAKAQSFQGMAASGRVHLPYGADADHDIDEYIRFPAGRNDDCVDAASQMGRALMEAHPAIVQPAQVRAVNSDPWGRPRRQEQDWRVA